MTMMIAWIIIIMGTHVATVSLSGRCMQSNVLRFPRNVVLAVCQGLVTKVTAKVANMPRAIQLADTGGLEYRFVTCPTSVGVCVCVCVCVCVVCVSLCCDGWGLQIAHLGRRLSAQWRPQNKRNSAPGWPLSSYNIYSMYCTRTMLIFTIHMRAAEESAQ